MAVQVPAESTYVHLVERELNRRGLAIRTINAGCNGFNTVQEYFFFRKLYKLGWRPRMVVLYVTNNDLIEDAIGVPYARYKVDDNGYIVLQPLNPAFLAELEAAKKVPPRQANFWLRKSAFLRHVWYYFKAIRGRSSATGYRYYVRDDLDPLFPEQFRVALAAVRSLNQLVTSYGGKLVIAVHPAQPEWSDSKLAPDQDRMKYQNAYRRIANHLGVPFIDMLEDFPSISVQEFSTHPDPHANASGHRIIASQLVKGFEKTGLLNSLGGQLGGQVDRGALRTHSR